jgi:hypothetical protein
LLPETAKEVVPGIVASIEEAFHDRLRQIFGDRRALPEIECKVYFSSLDYSRHPELNGSRETEE